MLCFKNRKEEEKMRTSLWKKVQVGLVSLSAVSLLAACGMDDTDEPVMEEDTTMMEESVDTTMDSGMDSEEVVDQDIVGVAQSNPDFSILVSALQKANLVGLFKETVHLPSLRLQTLLLKNYLMN